MARDFLWRYLNVSEIGHALADLPREREDVARCDRVGRRCVRIVAMFAGTRETSSFLRFQMSATSQVISTTFARDSPVIRP